MRLLDTRVGHSDESLIPSKIVCNRHILERLQLMSLSVVKPLYAIFDPSPATCAGIYHYVQ